MCKMGRCPTTTKITPSANNNMGTIVQNPRSRKVSLRFTEKEFLQIKTQMENSDYLSLSKYLRDKALDRVFYVKNVRYGSENLRKQINIVSANIAKIGVDYNQATKKFNTLAKMTRPDGSPVINVRAANYYLTRLMKLTQRLIDEHNRLIEDIRDKTENQCQP